MGKSNLDVALKKGELVIGFKSVVKAINAGFLNEVFVSSNGKVFLNKLKLITGDVVITPLDISSKELGIKCKKPFNIAVLGVKIGEKDLKTTIKKKKTVKSKETKKKVSKKKVTKKKETKKKPKGKKK